MQQLALLKGFDLAAMDPLGPEFVHTITECAKLAFADREAFYGDPDFCEVPLERLLSEAYNEQRRELVSESASFDLRPGEIEGYGGAIVMGQAPQTEGADARGGGEPTIQGGGGARGDTCHLDDGQGTRTHDRAEGRARHVLHGQKERAIGELTKVVDCCDIGMQKPARCAGLAAQTHTELLRPHGCRGHDLNCGQAVHFAPHPTHCGLSLGEDSGLILEQLMANETYV